jgi:hypothetical protein
MGQRGGPNIPLANINSYSDNLNKRSYSGTGNTVNCLFSKFDFSFINNPNVTTILKNIILSLNGSTQYATTNNNAGTLFGNANKSLSCWIYLNSTSDQSVIGFGNNSSGNTCFEITVSSGNFSFRTGPGYSWVLQTATANTWHHIAITYYTSFAIVGNYKFYVNGVQHSTGTASVSAAANTPLYIGNPIDTATFAKLNGSVSQPITYTTNLTSEQVQQIYTAQKGRYGL